MRLGRLLAAVCFSGLASLTLADLSSMDRKFMMTVAQGGAFEVAANKVGQQMAKHLEVKQHSMHMVADHSKANMELMKMAKRKGVRLPKSMDVKHEKILARLKGMKGGAFDKYHVEVQLKAHMDNIALFKKQAQHGKDAQLKEWARAKVPKLEEHLNMWQRAAMEIGVKS